MRFENILDLAAEMPYFVISRTTIATIPGVSIGIELTNRRGNV